MSFEACGFGSIMALPIEQCTQCFLASLATDPVDDGRSDLLT